VLLDSVGFVVLEVQRPRDVIDRDCCRSVGIEHAHDLGIEEIVGVRFTQRQWDAHRARSTLRWLAAVEQVR
jgi:hypothetical protein